MDENNIAREILDICFKLHRTTGAGLFETVYEEIVAYELKRNGMKYERQASIPVTYDGIILPGAFKADFIVEDKVIMELKSVEHIKAVHKKQVLTYLKLSHLRLGILINFNESLLKDGIKRIVNSLYTIKT